MCKYIDDLKDVHYRKSKIDGIAKKYGLTVSELKKYYQTQFFKNISETIDLNELSEISLDKIEKNLNTDELKNEFRFIKTDLKKIIEKSLYIATTNGFTTNINHVESGVMTANAVDKQVGICYIIPMDYADGLSFEKCKNVKLKEVECYKENWNIIGQKATSK